MGALAAGYRLTAGPTTVWPTLGVQYVHVNAPAFSEQGANAVDLGVSATATDWLRALAGVRLEYATTTAAGAQFTTDVYAAYSRQFLNPTPLVQTQLLGATASGFFTTWGVTPAADAVVLGAKFTLHGSDRYDLYAGYDVVLSSNETNQTVSAGVILHF